MPAPISALTSWFMYGELQRSGDSTTPSSELISHATILRIVASSVWLGIPCHHRSELVRSSGTSFDNSAGQVPDKASSDSDHPPPQPRSAQDGASTHQASPPDALVPE